MHTSNVDDKHTALCGCQPRGYVHKVLDGQGSAAGVLGDSQVHGDETEDTE